MYKDTKLFVYPDHNFIILYIILILIVVVSLYLLIKYKCNLTRLYRPKISEPYNVRKFVKPTDSPKMSISL